MDVSLPLSALVLLPCIVWTHVGANVLPPVNVTLHCHNMQNTLSWGYEGDSEEGLRFKVFVGAQSGVPGTLWVDFPNMSIDLSDFSDPKTDYSIVVSAVKGDVNVMAQDELSYSYYQDSPARVICSLDLPLVEITPLDENHFHFNFIHPGVIYPTIQKSRMKKSIESHDSLHEYEYEEEEEEEEEGGLPEFEEQKKDVLPDFDYHVEILKQNESHKYTCTQRLCEGKLQVHGREKRYCMNISGEMMKMSVRATKTYCSSSGQTPSSSLAYIVPVVLVLLGLVVGLIVYMLFVKKTNPSTPGPAALLFKGNIGQRPAPRENIGYAIANVEPPSPPSEPFIPPDEATSNSVSFQDEMPLPLRVLDDGPDNEPGDVAGAQGASEDGYKQGDCLEGDEDEKEEAQPPGAYEKRDNPALL